MRLTKSHSVRLLSASCGLALSLIAAAAVIIHQSSGRALKRQDALGATINIAGKQRMLSQRTAYLVTSLENGLEGTWRTEHLAALTQTLADMQINHDRLTRGDLLWHADHPEAAALAALYYEANLDHDVRLFLVHNTLFAEAVAAGRTPEESPMTRAELLPRLNQAVTLHEQGLASILSQTRRTSDTTFAVLLLLLLAEAILIFYPTAKRLDGLERKLTRAATTDPLTGIANRRSLFSAAQGMIGLAARTRRPIAVCVLDIDHFKRVNDVHGHATGDDAIRHVVAITKKTLRQSDLFGRVGGEEFVVFCPDTSEKGGRQVAEKVRIAIEEAPLDLDCEEEGLKLTVSIGVRAGLVRSDTAISDLVSDADQALYAAKTSGRNKVLSLAQMRAEKEEAPDTAKTAQRPVLLG